MVPPDVDECCVARNPQLPSTQIQIGLLTACPMGLTGCGVAKQKIMSRFVRQSGTGSSLFAPLGNDNIMPLAVPDPMKVLRAI